MEDDFAVLRKMEQMKKRKSRTFDSVLNKKKYDKKEMDDFFLDE